MYAIPLQEGEACTGFQAPMWPDRCKKTKMVANKASNRGSEVLADKIHPTMVHSYEALTWHVAIASHTGIYTFSRRSPLSSSALEPSMLASTHSPAKRVNGEIFGLRYEVSGGRSLWEPLRGILTRDRYWKDGHMSCGVPAVAIDVAKKSS